MRVYHPTNQGNHTLYIAPAADPRAAVGGADAEWTDDAGLPRTFEVCFQGGKAEVTDAIGRYLVATGQAKRTRLWTPDLIGSARRAA